MLLVWGIFFLLPRAVFDGAVLLFDSPVAIYVRLQLFRSFVAELFVLETAFVTMRSAFGCLKIVTHAEDLFPRRGAL